MDHYPHRHTLKGAHGVGHAMPVRLVVADAFLIGSTSPYIGLFDGCRRNWRSHPPTVKNCVRAMPALVQPWSYRHQQVPLVKLDLHACSISFWVGILVIGMLLMTIGEMIAFPFSNAFVMERAKKGKQGEYMAFYSISFSLAHIFSHNAGMQMIDRIGFDNTWTVITIIAVVGMLFLFYLMRILKKEQVIIDVKNN